ncbi:MAG TPA: glycosyltransferase [Polyangia bacterium]|nr:glycosyltransferase [Polyangia bacterium]
MRVSAVVPAYNEEKNIRRLLSSLLAQKMSGGQLTELVVVASGCTDTTHAQVEAVARADARVRMIVQDARMGKTAALNAYTRERDPRADVIVMSSADLLVQPGCLQVFLDAFANHPRVGMVGARPVPTNPRGTLMGDVVHFLWALHHEIALEAPKLGEIVAVRGHLLVPLPQESPVDEASLEAHVVAQGYALRYLPDALVVNRGPDNIREFIDQRRRIAAGHFWLRDSTGYAVSTLDARRIVKHALQHLTLSDPKTDASYLAAAALEALARGLGWLDFRRHHSHAVWKVAPSTRQVVRIPAEAVPTPLRSRKAGYG